MPFEWKHLFDFAKYLYDKIINTNELDGILKEPALRSIVARCYYASFRETVKFSESKLGFKSTKNRADHREIIRHLDKRSRDQRDPIYAYISSRLKVLIDDRETSDYELIYDVEDEDGNKVELQDTAEYAIKSTEKIFESLEKLKKRFP